MFRGRVGVTLPMFIFMSATIDMKLFIRYFKLKPNYHEIGIIRQTPESLALKYSKSEFWITESDKLDVRFKKCLDMIYKQYLDEKIYLRSRETDEIVQKDILIFCANTPQMTMLLEVYENHPFKTEKKF